MKLLIIYHDNCIDGFTAAWAAHKVLKKGTWESIELHAGQYGRNPPYDQLDSNTTVVIVDFSYRKATLEDIALNCAQLTVLDHHKTAQEDLATFAMSNATVVFDMNRSGAGLAWDYFMPGEPRPSIIDLVEDRDLWKFKLADSKPFHEYVMMMPRDLVLWNQLSIDLANLENYANIMYVGRKLLEYQESAINKILKAGKMPIIIDGISGLACNCPGIFASDAGHLLANESGTFGATWSEAVDKTVKFSLRSNGDFDVSAIAKKFGGGGHKNAAGFELGTAMPKQMPSQVWSAEYFKSKGYNDPDNQPEGVQEILSSILFDKGRN